ncbi:hypothetical protein Micbo1qcDRAFT_200076 [Microdochium bolleyi]|uniref:Conidiation protein 6-domain-containing protein n=1 Tax=Microdochium bolleyi TaxID=196109 RepID=A0A136JJP3_9PEZI|nr:hypothetical protein Micbo1qcDRAFT_200076 [Microdochium bolleyi]
MSRDVEDEAAKENSRNAIEALGGDGAHYSGNKDDPQSKNAADKIGGSRATAN